MTALRRTIPLWLAAVTAAGCAAGPEPDPGASQRRSSKLDGVAFTLRERAHDGTFVVPPASATPTEVDANARLVVSFQVEPQAELAAAGTEWQAFEAGLGTVQQLLGEGRELDTLEVDENDPAAVAQLQERLRQHYRRLGQFGREFQKAITLHRNDLDVNSILGGPAGNREPPLVNAARWLADELGRLRRAAGARVTNRERIRVLVQAYHEPLDGERQPLHVANYDKLPVGDLRPIDRYGLKLTPQERARLDAEIAASKRAASAIRELQAGAKDFLEKVEQEVAELRLAVGTLANTVRSAADWRQRLTVSLEALTQLANSTADAEVKGAAGELATTFPRLLASLESIGAQGNTAQLLDRIAAALREGQPQAVLECLGDLRAVVESDLAALVEELQPHLATIGKAVATLTERLGAAELQTLLPAPVREVLASLPGELPATFTFVTATYEFLAAGAQKQKVAELLASGRDDTIPRPLDDLPDATIDLTRAGVNLDDHVGVHVRFEEQRQDGGHDLLEEVAVDTELVLTGLHRRIGGELIFARADRGSGAAQQWQANVAAVAGWHYHCRDAHESDWETVWNFLDPGLGVHVASLDQNDDTAEVGLGVNVSLFGGFLTGGLGYNLATEDGDGLYYFVGIDLMDVLRQAGSVTGSR